MPENWPLYYERTKDLPPSALLTQAMAVVDDQGAALDFGSGALRDSRFLLSQGFHQVIAIDKEPPPGDAYDELLRDGRFLFHRVPFEKMLFPHRRFNLVSAQFSLPFVAPDAFARVWEDLCRSLAIGGVFTGQFFGTEDGWHGRHGSKTFHTEAQVRELLSAFEPVLFHERKWEGALADGTPKRWHVFDVIVRKP